MLKLSVCIDSVFRDDPLAGVDRLPGLGYSAFEFWGWWGRDLDALVAAKERLGLRVATFCTRMVSLVDPTQRDTYLAGLAESLKVAKRLGCDRLITQTGQDTGAPRAEQYAAMKAGLQQCLPLLEESKIVLLVEPLNEYDHPGYYLKRSNEAFRLVKEIDSPYVKVLYDIYHQQLTEGDILNTIEANLSLIGHFHSAGVPGRHELDSGELDYSNIMRAIGRMGYAGYFGLEYFPAQPVEDGLARALELE